MSAIELPDLALACSRLRLDAGLLVESVLCKVDAGYEEMEAVRMSIIEALQRRGAYHGRLKQAIDDGTIFQMTEGGNGDGGTRGRLGGSRFREAAASLPTQGKWVGEDDPEW